MKPCGAVRKALTAYLDQELTPGRARWVEGHVQTCDPCRKELEGLRRMTVFLRSLPAPSRPQGYWPEALRKLRVKVQDLPRPTGTPLWERFLGVIEHPVLTLVPVAFALGALVSTLAALELEEEAWTFFLSYLLPLLLG